LAVKRIGGMLGRRAEKREHRKKNPNAPDHSKPLSPALGKLRRNRLDRDRESHSAGCAKILAAGFGAPIRNLRSDNDKPPPSAITKAPIQISSTSGL
jgi:hypothetical protein